METSMRPNIVLILADDLGVGDIASAGNKFVHTPSLDRLRSESMSFSHHYSNSPVCAPARAALMTGRYPHRTGVIDVRELRGLSRLSLRETLIPQILRMLGYRTGLVGKWHLGAGRDEYLPTSRGFDHFVGFLGGLSDYWDYHLYRNAERWNSDGTYLTHKLTEEALGFIRSNDGEPFFLEVAFNAPHEPLQAPEDMLSLYEGDPLSAEVRTLYAMVTAMDLGIGRILDQLNESGLAENTIVIFTSDNGPDFAGGPQLTHTVPTLRRYNCGLRGHKGVVFDGGVRVPCFLRWPAGGVQAGSECNALTQFVDWLPTLVELAGAPQVGASDSSDLDGRSLVGLMGSGGTAAAPSTFVAQWNRYAPVPRCNAAIRDGDWKLVWPPIEAAMTAFPEDSAADRLLHKSDSYPSPLQYSEDVDRHLPATPVRPMLFDISADPYELDDVSLANPLVVTRLADRLDAWFENVEAERHTVVNAGLCV